MIDTGQAENVDAKEFKDEEKVLEVAPDKDATPEDYPETLEESDSKEIPLETMKKSSGLFRSRMATEDFHVTNDPHEDTVFKLQAMSSVMTSYLNDKNTKRGQLNQGAFTLDYFKFGIIAIEGLRNEDGVLIDIPFKKTTINRKEYLRVPDEIVEGLPEDFIQLVAIKIRQLSGLSDEELRRLGFTSNLSALTQLLVAE